MSDAVERRERICEALLAWLYVDSRAERPGSTPAPEVIAAQSDWSSGPILPQELLEAAFVLRSRGLLATVEEPGQPPALRITSAGTRVLEQTRGRAMAPAPRKSPRKRC
ncbi:hypothetical protein [Nocardia sp. NPDC004722]